MIYEKLESEVRAKIFWGDEPAEVISYLQSQGATEQEAKELIASLEAERDASVRALGRKKIILGALLVPLPFVTWAIFLQIHWMSLKLLGLMAAIGLFGVWKIILGLVNVFSPRAIRVDLSDDDAR